MRYHPYVLPKAASREKSVDNFCALVNVPQVVLFQPGASAIKVSS